jgi:hypothetical protein
MNEIIFLVEEALEGGYTAKAIGESIFTEADSMALLKINIKEAASSFISFKNFTMRFSLIKLSAWFGAPR